MTRKAYVWGLPACGKSATMMKVLGKAYGRYESPATGRRALIWEHDYARPAPSTEGCEWAIVAANEAPQGEYDEVICCDTLAGIERFRRFLEDNVK